MKQRIDSVLNQTYPHFEMIIIDDGSTDNSKEIIESYRHNPKVRTIIYNETNSGSPYLQWDKGINEAKGKWIWIAESDDYAEPSFLQIAASMLDRYPSAGIFYCDSIIRSDQDTPINQKFSAIKNEFFKTAKWNSDYFKVGIDEINANLGFVCTINNASAAVFKKSLYKNMEIPIHNFRFHGDWYVYLSIALQADVCYHSQALNHYRQHAASFLHLNIQALQSRKEYFQILRVLYNKREVMNKGRLAGLFTLQYLSFPIKKEISNAVSIAKSYFKIDFKLALRVVILMIFYKAIRKENKPLF